MLCLDVALLSVLVALLFDAVVGWPAALFLRIGHPVTWLGALIAWLDRCLNKATLPFSQRRYYGVLSLIVLIALVGGSAAVLQIALITSLPSWLAIIFFTALTTSWST